LILNDEEKTILRSFMKLDATKLPNRRIIESTGLDEIDVREALRTMEKKKLVRRYVGSTELRTRGRIYAQKIGDHDPGSQPLSDNDT